MAAIYMTDDTIRQIETILSKVLSSISDSCIVEQDLKALAKELRNVPCLLAEDTEEDFIWETDCSVLFENVVN